MMATSRVSLSVDILLSLFAPTVSEYLPIPQGWQGVWEFDEYFPATQAVHGPPSGPVYPGLQVQSVILSLVWGELDQVGHRVQLGPGAAVSKVSSVMMTHQNRIIILAFDVLARSWLWHQSHEHQAHFLTADCIVSVWTNEKGRRTCVLWTNFNRQ